MTDPAPHVRRRVRRARARRAACCRARSSRARTVVGARLRDRPRLATSSTRSSGRTRSSCASRSRVEAEIGDGATVGPFAHLRPGTRLGAGCASATSSRPRTPTSARARRRNHLAYIGDAEIGAGRQHRCRHHHRQLRRARQAPHHDRRATCASGRTRCWSRRWRSATAPYTGAGAVVHRDVPAGRARQGRAGADRGRLGASARGRRRWPASERPRGEDPARQRASVEYMELVTKKRLMLFAGRGNEQLSKEIAECLDVAARRHRALDVRQRRDLLPLRREHPRRRPLRDPEPLRADQRPHHGAADHDRRRQARVGEAHHRGVSLLRVRAVRTGRPRAASRSPRGSSPTCSPPPAPTAS